MSAFVVSVLCGRTIIKPLQLAYLQGAGQTNIFKGNLLQHEWDLPIPEIPEIFRILLSVFLKLVLYQNTLIHFPVQGNLCARHH